VVKPAPHADDQRYMQHALALADRQLGRVAPNPAVGCVLVKDGVIIGRGATADGGRPHAEAQALLQAGSKARGCEAYVTLEPCSHHGKTPPCAEALIDAGVARVVVAAGDPDPRVNGGGIVRLRRAGIAVTTGMLEAEAQQQNAGFLSRVTRGRPHICLKLATSIDGRIALANGESQWITGTPARAFGHGLRARYDAILIGSQTLIDDDPSLTCRLGAGAHSPVRIILDGRLRAQSTHQVMRDGLAPTVVITGAGQPRPDFGDHVDSLHLRDPHDVEAVAKALGDRGLTRVLIEGGGQVAAAFLNADLVDEIVHFTGPIAIGGDGRPAVAPLLLDRLALAPRFDCTELRKIGADSLACYRRAE